MEAYEFPEWFPTLAPFGQTAEDRKAVRGWTMWAWFRNKVTEEICDRQGWLVRSWCRAWKWEPAAAQLQLPYIFQHKLLLRKSCLAFFVYYQPFIFPSASPILQR